MAVTALLYWNIFTYLHSIHQFYNNKDLTTEQKIYGIVPRALGIAVDSSTLGKIGVDFLKKISSGINGVMIPLLDIVAKEESCEDAFCTALSNLAHLSTDQDRAILVSSLINKRPLVKKIYTKTAEKIYTYYKSTVISSLSNVERVSERIQEEKAKFLKYLETQESKLDFIEKNIQDYQNIINNVKAESFGSIPYCYMHRPEFEKRKCSLSTKPVRAAVVIREKSLPIYYECYHLLGWHDCFSGQPPPAWPKSISFNLDIIVVDKVETAQITEDLQKALDQTQNNPEELEAMKIGFLAVQEIKEFYATEKS